jgi:hypothetical protein
LGHKPYHQKKYLDKTKKINMDNKIVVKEIKRYLNRHKSVDINWYLNDKENGLGVTKNDREIDIIVQTLLDKPWFKQYSGHNPNDISIKYNFLEKLSFYGGIFGGIVGTIGGIMGILSFFFKGCF